MTSILESQPLKTRPFPMKKGHLGSRYTYICIHSRINEIYSQGVNGLMSHEKWYQLH